MLTGMSTTTRRFLCGRCFGDLGTYRLLGLGPHAPQITPVRLARGMVFWEDDQPKPRRFFRVESASRLEQANRVGKYRWRCGCGHSPVYLPKTLAALVPPAGDVVLR